MNFEILVNTIQSTHNQLQQNAIKSINKHLTIRNWLVGFYIVEFEQNGSDRAKYGERLLKELAKSVNLRGLSETNLKLFRQFYFQYPQIGQIVPEQLNQLGFNPIRQSATDQLQTTSNQSVEFVKLPIAQFKSVLPNDLQVPPERLINNLSFTHLTLLFPIENPLKRTLYEIECMKGNWSVQELKQQTIKNVYQLLQKVHNFA